MLTLLFTKPHSAINPLGQNTVKYSGQSRGYSDRPEVGRVHSIGLFGYEDGPGIH